MSEQLFSISPSVRGYVNLPMTVSIKGLEKSEAGAWALEDTATGEIIPLQPESGWFSRNAWLRFVLPSIEKGQERTFRLKATPPFPVRAEVKTLEGDRKEFLVDGKLVTRYHFGKDLPRPFLWPLVGPDDKEMTRAWPIVDDRGDEKRDHVHHRSMWTALGDVNGSDNWSEAEGHGRTEHDTFAEEASGPVFCRVATKESWLSATGEKLMRSYTEVLIYATPDGQRLMDYTVCFRGLDKPVRVGDTKENGLIALRVASSMDGTGGGVIENAYGGIGEKECWGKQAPWVDYSGTVGDGVYGIAVFDHPDNPLYPTRWHVRDYGLMTSNPFALHDYYDDESRDGSQILQPGEVWRYHYRVVLHRGGADAAKIRDQYLGFANPPEFREVTA